MKSHFSQTLNEQPESIQNLVSEIVGVLKPKKVILFGSRARKSHRPNSDFDLACIFENKSEKDWIEFLVRLNDSALTLHSVDLVDFAEMSPEYQKNILSEGLVVYE